MTSCRAAMPWARIGAGNMRSRVRNWGKRSTKRGPGEVMRRTAGGGVIWKEDET